LTVAGIALPAASKLIQTGVGRTGKFLAAEHAGVKPDVLALAKGLGGGFPIGAMLCKRELEQALPPGSHGSTFGGNALASAVALATLQTLEREGLVANAASVGSALHDQLRSLALRHPKKVRAVRGLGLLQGLVLKDDVDPRALLARLRDDGLLVTIAGGTALRFSPPLVVTREQVGEAIAIVYAALVDTTVDDTAVVDTALGANS
jgi:acetylornithine/N-succinyldiaminopimelate aminotransferase